MKKFAAVCVCLILASFILVPNRNVYSQANDRLKNKYVEGEIIVKLKDNIESIAEQEIPEMVLSVRGEGVERLTQRHTGNINLVRFNPALSVEQAVQRAQKDPRVEYAEPNYLLEAANTVPNDVFFGAMWGLSNGDSLFSGAQTAADISATRAWDITTGSDDLVVAVIDTGAKLSHPDLSPNAWVNPRENPNNGVDDDGNGFVDDKNGWNFYDKNKDVFQSASDDLHGTHVAGTIGAVGNNGEGTTGVAWHVKLMSLKFLGGSKGSGSTSNAIKAINYVIDQKNRGTNVRVINASWGDGSDSQSLREAIAAAGNVGIVFVCAAGNGGSDGFGDDIDEIPDFPAGYSTSLDNVISVAAIDSGDNLAGFSNFGHSSVTVAAPGVGIWSTVPDVREYAPISGTSMASPHVAGIVALMLSNKPSLTPKQVRDIIVSTAEPTTALASKIVSSGRVSAYNALTETPAVKSKPVITQANVSKKKLTINGIGFLSGSSIIEVNGVAISDIKYDDSYSVGNGTISRLRSEPGKKTIKKMFPKGQLVDVTIFNPTTGERSPKFATGLF
ncbi:MAG TPA: S8 family peptidase [Blastocatellia bacterium]|nr:S8 family peptidase [Blastocatellia bacterium]